MVGDKGLKALLESIEAWLERAGDDEVLALNRIVRAELERRRLRPDTTSTREEQLN